MPDTASALLNFDGISYSKGAAALRQLVTWLGEKDFLAGINDHFARHRFGNATLADFIDSLARASGRDVHAWADRWLRTTGVDTLTATVTGAGAEAPGTGAGPAADAGTGSGPAARSGTGTGPAAGSAAAGSGPSWQLTVRHTGTRPHRLTVHAYDRADDPAAGPVLRDRFPAEVPADGDGTPLTLPGTRPDLVLLNATDDAYAKVRLDPASLDSALTGLSGLPGPLARATVWTTLRDMVRDGDLPPAAYLDAARAHLPHERDNAVVQGVLGFARYQVADRYLPPDARPVALATLTTVCRDLLRLTGDSSAGLRLSAARTFLGAATDPGELHALLADETFPAGPRLDPELRWRLLYRLAVLGATDTDAVGAELERDPSATGREGAARCRAALPDPAAKEAAWRDLFDADELSTRVVAATAEGFWQPEQQELLARHTDRYFPAAVASAARRGPAVAAVLGGPGFPFHAVTPDTLRRGEECLRDAGPVPALRRKLADQLADLARALRVRESLAAG
ncbi:hypothetical protein CRI70_09695 [Streptomyces sp. Ru87]|nr:hypothetical protein CRI70_09695 [Streptomyces sp. Ru87]